MAANHHNKGQALAELAIFGAITLVAVAGLVRIGLQYFYQQQVTHEAFRTALYYANNHAGENAHDNILGQGNVTVTHERYIPDTSRPFAIGQRTPFTSAASISWGNRSGVSTPNRQWELPKAAFFMNGADIKSPYDEVVNSSGSPTIIPNAPFRPVKFIGYVIPSHKEEELCQIFFDPDFPNSNPSTEQKVACREALDWGPRDGSYDTVDRHSGAETLPAVGPPATMSNPSWHRPTFIIMDGCASALSSDIESCSRQCSRIYSRIGYIPPYCGSPGTLRYNKHGRRRWEWSKWLPGNRFPGLGTDLNNFTRSMRGHGEWNNLSGQPGEQTITLDEHEEFRNRVFRMKSADASSRHGTYEPLSLNLSTPPFWVPQGGPAPKPKSKTWITPP